MAFPLLKRHSLMDLLPEERGNCVSHSKWTHVLGKKKKTPFQECITERWRGLINLLNKVSLVGQAQLLLELLSLQHHGARIHSCIIRLPRINKLPSKNSSVVGKRRNLLLVAAYLAAVLDKPLFLGIVFKSLSELNGIQHEFILLRHCRYTECLLR